MRLVGQLYITVPSARVKRDPTFMEKLKRGFGGQVDLDTAEVQNQLEATSVVDAVRRALGRLGVGNALSLVIDETVVFQDSDGKADDLPDLVLALADHASLFGRGFRELKFAAEHEEAGLHLVIETRARTRHRHDDPAAVVSIGGRIRKLEPEKGESAEAYRARVEPLTRDAALFEASRLAFESFVARLRDALGAAMPEARVTERRAEARVVKAPSGATEDPSAIERTPREPTHPAYDPFAVYYPSPMTTVLDAMLFASFMHMLMPPPVLLVSPWGSPLGLMSDVQAHPQLAEISDFDRAGVGDFGDDRDQRHDDRASLASDDDASSDDDQSGHADAGQDSDAAYEGDDFDDGADDGGGWSDGGWDDAGWDDGGGGNDD